MQHPVRCANPECENPVPPSRRLHCSRPCGRRASYLRNRELEIAKASNWNRTHERAARRRRTLARQIAARLKRPRCVVCSAPINWANPNVNNQTRTCGKPRCSRLAHAWFGPMKPRGKAA